MKRMETALSLIGLIFATIWVLQLVSGAQTAQMPYLVGALFSLIAIALRFAARSKSEA